MPWIVVTDNLASYTVAHPELLASVEHRRSKLFDNRAENSHQPTRLRERDETLSSVKQAQRFLSAISSI